MKSLITMLLLVNSCYCFWSIQGLVKDSSGNPICSAHVYINQSGKHVLTDKSGKFEDGFDDWPTVTKRSNIEFEPKIVDKKIFTISGRVYSFGYKKLNNIFITKKISSKSILSKSYSIRAFDTLVIGKIGYEIKRVIVKDTLRIEENVTLYRSKIDSVKDIDGNTYKTIKIGNRIWMSENLRTTKYNDGSPIKLITSNATWTTTNGAAYCWHGNNESMNSANFGALYNWYAVSRDSSKSIAPAGWRVANSDDWSDLYNQTLAWNRAEILKSEGRLWSPREKDDEPNNNISGFSASAGGQRDSLGVFGFKAIICCFWGPLGLGDVAHYYGFWNWNQTTTVYGFRGLNYGLSVRCVKDTP